METYRGDLPYVFCYLFDLWKKRVVFNIGTLLGSKYVQPFGVGFRTHARAIFDEVDLEYVIAAKIAGPMASSARMTISFRLMELSSIAR